MKVRIRTLHYLERRKFKTHILKMNYKDKIMQEVYNGWIKYNIIMDIGENKYSTSITLKKNIVALWLVMMDKVHVDHNRVVIEFIQNVCMKRWRGSTAKGMSDFVTKCMIHSMLEESDYLDFKNVYLGLNARVKNPRKNLKTNHGEGHIKVFCDLPEI